MTDPGFSPMPETVALKSVRWGRLLTWVVVLGLLGLVGWKLWQVSLAQVSSGPAPDFTLNTFSSGTFRLSEQRGKVVVINFWASWCIPCRDEAPVLERVWREYRNKGVVIVGVAYLDVDEAARAFIAEFDQTYPNGPDVGTVIAPRYRIKGVPETYFVDGSGQLRDLFIGPLRESDLRQRIETLLRSGT